MEQAEVVTYKYEVSAEQMVRFHLLSYTHMNAIELTKGDMNALVLLALRGTPTLIDFCDELVKRQIYLSLGSARNAIGELCTEKNLIVKTGNYKKKVSLSPAINLSLKHNTLLSINCLLR